MVGNLTLSNVVDHLLIAVPELRPAYEQMLKEWRGELPGAYIVYGDLFVDYIVALSEETDKPAKLGALVRAMLHLEVLSAHSDFDVWCLSKVGVLEQLFGTKGRMERLAPFMGRATRRLAIEYGVKMLFEVDWLKRLSPSKFVRD